MSRAELDPVVEVDDVVYETAPSKVRSSIRKVLTEDGDVETYVNGSLVCRKFENGTVERYDAAGKLHGRSAISWPDGTVDHYEHGVFVA